jgi:hypothetical protein
MRRSVMLAMLMATLAGAELIIADLRLGAVWEPAAFAYHYRDAVGARTGTDSFAHPLGVTLGGRTALGRPGSPWGLVLAVDLAAGAGGYGGTTAWRWAEARGGAGVGYACTARWSIALLAEGGLGRAALDVPDGIAAGFTADGTARSHALVAEASWLAAPRWRWTLAMRVAQREAELADGERQLDVQQRGLAIALGLAWVVSPRPRRLGG